MDPLNGIFPHVKKSFTNSRNDLHNQRRIKLLHPEVQVLCLQHLYQMDCLSIHMRITQTLRTFKEQDDLYALGRTAPGKIVTNAKGGYSWHNFGLAYDIVIIGPNGKANWDTNSNEWKLAVEKGIEVGMEHGIKVGKFIDYPHFQYRPKDANGKHLTLASMRKLWEQKGILESFGFI